MVAMSHTLDPVAQRHAGAARSGHRGRHRQHATPPTINSPRRLGRQLRHHHRPDATKAAPPRRRVADRDGHRDQHLGTVMANPALTGEFMWTGVDYLGEADGAWPTVGSNAGIMDELGTVKPLGYRGRRSGARPRRRRRHRNRREQGRRHRRSRDAADGLERRLVRQGGDLGRRGSDREQRRRR